MKLLGFENTRLTELFLASRVEGQPYLPAAITQLVERYKFAEFPSKLGEGGAERASFKHGLFQGSAIETFDVYRDGIIVESKSPSDLLDAFINDICSWMADAIGLKRIETHAISKNYESHLVFESSAPLFKALDGLTTVSDFVANALKATTGLEAEFQAIGFGFAPDNSLISGMKPIPFRVERKAGVEFQMNYYYSSAPLTTAKHLAALERLEGLVG
jgi:hypothetical protein